MNLQFNSIAFQLPLISFIIIGIIAITYLGKNVGMKKAENYEKKLFDYILVSSLIYAFLNTAVHMLCSLHTLDVIYAEYFEIVNVINKILVGLLVTISMSLFLYTLVISYDKIKNKFYNYAFFHLLVFFIFVGLVGFVDVELIYTGTSYNVTGYMPTVTYFFVGIYMFAATIVNLINFRRSDKRFFVLFYILIIALVLILVSAIVPGIIVYDFGLAVVCFIMFHTIENPDLKLISALNIAKNDAVKANSAKSDFLSRMSHEIRTPLNAIIGLSTDLVDNEDFPAELKGDAEDIVYASNTLLDIVGNIMDISKIERNKMEIINEEYSFKEIVEDIVKLNEFRLKDKDLVINVNMDDTIPYKLYGDKIHVKQILNNLISNSIKYTDKGFLKISARAINNENISTIVFSVQDTGLGIKKEMLNKLFNRFERLGAEKNSTTEGTGLGLAISKELVELLGGNIYVNSEYGKGSLFIVKLPQKVVSLKHDLNEEIIELVEDVDIDITGKKVLVVDDNMLNIKVAVKALKPLNVIVDTCRSGFACIELVNKNEYDVILLDIMMPEMSGVETLHKLKENKAFKVPVVAITADAVLGIREKYLKDGFDEYISKPFSKDVIKKILGKVIK